MRSGAVSCAIALVLLAGCSDKSGSAATVRVAQDTIPATDLRDVVPGLCATRAATGQRAARASFYDLAHAELHQIAIAVEPIDRPLAGRLLERMQRVEADLTAEPARPGQADDVGALIDVARSSLIRLRVAAANCKGT